MYVHRASTLLDGALQRFACGTTYLIRHAESNDPACSYLAIASGQPSLASSRSQTPPWPYAGKGRGLGTRLRSAKLALMNGPAKNRRSRLMIVAIDYQASGTFVLVLWQGRSWQLSHYAQTVTKKLGRGLIKFSETTRPSRSLR